MYREKQASQYRNVIPQVGMRLPLSLVFLFCLFFLVPLASGQTFKKLHTFAAAPDGNFPHAGGVFDANGNLFGTTQWGGTNGSGTIWKVSKAGVFSVVYNFVGYNDGEGPNGSVVFDAGGNLYGTAQYGGTQGSGTVWKMTPGGVVTCIYDFPGNSYGGNPSGGVALDGLGDIYGTATTGGFGYGMVWVINSFGTFTDLWPFTGQADGATPTAGPTLDANGNLYGTTSAGASIGGAYGQGTVWEISAKGFFTVVHTFTGGTDGAVPVGSVSFDVTGNMYGTAAYDGAFYSGTVWKVDTSGTFSVVHAFTGGVDGSNPASSVIFDSSGNMYGTAQTGGSSSDGTVWEITNPGSFNVLKAFTGSDGSGPQGTPAIESSGNLYGTTVNGGSSYGTIYELVAPSLSSVTTSVGVLAGGQSTTGTVSFSGNVPTDTVVTLSSSDGNAQVPASVTVLAGSSSASFTITTSPLYSASDVVKIIATYKTKSVNCPLGLTLSATVHYISLAPNSMIGGASTTGTVYLSASAPFDVPVTLATSSTSAQLPVSVTIPSGSTFATFSVSTSAVYVVTPINISATLGSKTVGAQLLLAPTDSVHAVSSSPNSVTGGSASTGTVTLTSPAPTGGTVVTLSTSSPDAQVPATVTVPAGSTTATFTITTSGVFATEFITVSATLGSKTVSSGFGIGASAVMHYVVIAPGTVIGGTSTTGTVFLNGPAPLGGAVVTLSASDPSAQVPATVTIPAGSISAPFTITSTPVSSNTLLTVTATLNGISANYGLLVCAPHLAGIEVPKTSLVGGTSELLTIILSGPAPTGGYVVNLSTSTSFATLPATVTIPAGETFAKVTLASSATTNPILFIVTGSDALKSYTINMILQL